MNKQNRSLVVARDLLLPRLMLEEIARHAAEGRSFAFETTLSGLTYARMITGWRAAGFAVKLIFLSLATPFTMFTATAWITGSGSTTVATPRY